MHILSGKQKEYKNVLIVLSNIKIGTNPATIGDYHFDGSSIIHYSDMSNSIISGKVNLVFFALAGIVEIDFWFFVN